MEYKNVDYWYTTEDGDHIPVVNSNSSSDLYQNIKDTENKRRGLKHEELSIFDRNGTIKKEIKGEEQQVDAREYKDLMKDSIVTHNHPMGDTFSLNDLKEFVNNDIYELRASNDNGAYSIKRENKIDSKLLEDYKEMESDAYKYSYEKLNEKIKNNELDYIPRENPYKYNLDRQRYNAEYKDKWLKENASKYGYNYNKEEK